MPGARFDAVQVPVARRWPDRIGSYELVRSLGAGGMGVVFEARHRAAGDRVALKLMTPGARGAHEEERFSREIVALGCLEHESVVRLLDFGRSADGLRFLVMEYIPGLTLSQLVAQSGPQPAERALPLLRQLCAAMAEAHAAGIAHRDLKPSNVMVSTCRRRGQRVKVIDFGLAKLPGAEPSNEASNPGIFVGTPGYAPPEVWSSSGGGGAGDGIGKGGEARGDVYALGLIAHHLLTACGPPDPIEALLHRSRRVIADSRRHGPSWLPPLISRCLSNDPRRRFADAGELLRALPPMA
jgi:eukaryotic-like serine/threonine-protein kinase